MRAAMVAAMILGGALLIAGGGGKPEVDTEVNPAPVNLTISLEDSPGRAWIKANAGYVKNLNKMLRELAAEAESFPESDAAADAYAAKSVKASADAFLPWESYTFKTSVQGKAWSSAAFKKRCLDMAAEGDKAIEALRPLLE